jgi:hypothetical protein
VDTKTMWWNSHNHSKWAFICKYNCTIKGLELNDVLEEKLHGLDILPPDSFVWVWVWVCLSFSIINLVSSASSSSSSSRISSDSSKSSSLLLGSKGRCCAADWLRFFAITQVLFFFSAERVPISDLPNKWWLYYPPLITTLLKLQYSLLPVSAAACCSRCSSRRSYGICLRRSGWN